MGQICKKAVEDVCKFRELILLTEDNEEDVKSVDRSGAKHELLKPAMTHVSIPHLGLQDNGLVIPVVKRIAVGGQIFKEKNEVEGQLTTMFSSLQGHLRQELYVLLCPVLYPQADVCRCLQDCGAVLISLAAV